MLLIFSYLEKKENNTREKPMITTLPKSRQQIRQIRRNENKSIRALNTAEILLASKIKRLLNQVFSENELNQIAIQTKFQTRSRKLTPFAVVSILLMGCLNGTEDVASLEIMCCFLRKWFKIHILPQSLQEKINSKNCADFIKTVATKVIMHEINKTIPKLAKKTKSFFRILLQDSTVISLPETVSRIFKGCGGSASKAAVKCDVILDQNNHLIIKWKWISGKIPDSCLSSDILDVAQEGDLIIRDMGYFNLPHFSLMIKRNIRFISRLKSGANLYLKKDDEKQINIIEYLNKSNIDKNKIDLDFYLGKEERIHIRIIGLKVPQEVVKARCNQYIKAHGRKKTPSEDLIKWYEYTLMITNIPRKSLSLRSILKLYRIRWQIELFFKNMKSQLKVDNFTGKNKYRILCLLYSKLSLTWISAVLFAYASSISRCTISPVKFTKWLRDVGNWQGAIARSDFAELIEAFKRDVDLLKKQPKKKRSRYIKKRKVRLKCFLKIP